MSNFSFQPPSTNGHPSNFGITLNIQLPSIAPPAPSAAPLINPDIEVESIAGNINDSFSTLQHDTSSRQIDTHVQCNHPSFSRDDYTQLLTRLSILEDQGTLTECKIKNLEDALTDSKNKANELMSIIEEEKSKNEELQQDIKDLEVRLCTKDTEHQLMIEKSYQLQSELRDLRSKSDESINNLKLKLRVFKDEVKNDLAFELEKEYVQQHEKEERKSSERIQAIVKADQNALAEVSKIKEEVVQDRNKMNKSIAENLTFLKRNLDDVKNAAKHSQTAQAQASNNWLNRRQTLDNMITSNTRLMKTLMEKHKAALKATVKDGVKTIKEAEVESIVALNTKDKMSLNTYLKKQKDGQIKKSDRERESVCVNLSDED